MVGLGLLQQLSSCLVWRRGLRAGLGSCQQPQAGGECRAGLGLGTREG